MKATERYALFTAIAAAAKAEAEAAAKDALAVAGEVGIRKFATEVGDITVAQKDPAPVWDEDDLLAWVKERHPSEVVTVQQVRPAFRAVLVKRFVIAGDKVLDTATGEVVEFARISEPGDPYLTWPSSTRQKSAKEEVSRWFGERAESLANLAHHQITGGES